MDSDCFSEGGGEKDDRDDVTSSGGKSNSVESIHLQQQLSTGPNTGQNTPVQPRTASIRSRPTSSRITAAELEVSLFLKTLHRARWSRQNARFLACMICTMMEASASSFLYSRNSFSVNRVILVAKTARQWWALTFSPASPPSLIHPYLQRAAEFMRASRKWNAKEK